MSAEIALAIGGVVAVAALINRLCGSIEKSKIETVYISTQVTYQRGDARHRLLNQMRVSHDKAFETWLELKSKAEQFKKRCADIYQLLRGASAREKKQLARRLEELKKSKDLVIQAKQRAHAAWQALLSAYSAAKRSGGGGGGGGQRVRVTQTRRVSTSYSKRSGGWF